MHLLKLRAVSRARDVQETVLFPPPGHDSVFSACQFLIAFDVGGGCVEAVFGHWSNRKRLMPRLLAFFPHESKISEGSIPR